MVSGEVILGGFPSTRVQPWAQWLAMGEHGLAKARAQLMESYTAPLERYCAAIGLARSLGMEPTDVVHGFFASRLGTPDYLGAWSRSGMPLRNWLRNGVHLYVHELRRARMRDARAHAGDGALPDVGSAESWQFERLWVLSVLEGAVKKAADALDAKGRSAEWQMFWQHHVDDRPHEAIGQAFGCSAADSAQACFRVRGLLREAIAQTLCADGVRDEEMIQEIMAMLEMLHGQ